MHSLQSRLSGGLIVTLIILFTVQWVVVNLSIDRLTESYVGARLQDDTEGLLAGIRFDANGRLNLDTPYISTIYRQPFSGHYYLVRTETDTLRSRSLWDENFSIQPEAAGDKSTRYMTGPQGQQLLVLTSGFQVQGQTVSIATAQDLTPIRADITRFELYYALVTAGVLILLVFAQAMVVRGGLRPLDRVRQDIARFEQGETRHLDEQVPREIGPLVQQINRLIATLDQRLLRSRNALGNLAHSLKTPLTVLTQLSERPVIRDNPTLHRELTQQLQQLSRRMERELTRARVAGSGKPGRHFPVKDELEPLLAMLKSAYQEKGLTIEAVLPEGLMVAGDREDLLELLGNLLDNACKWANHRVRLNVETHKALTFTLEDDGPGCPADLRDQLTQRGIRLDESTSGHGLGLAIVKDIVDDYQGEIRFGTSQRLGGLWVYVKLGSDV